MNQTGEVFGKLFMKNGMKIEDDNRNHDVLYLLNKPALSSSSLVTKLREIEIVLSWQTERINEEMNDKTKRRKVI